MSTASTSQQDTESRVRDLQADIDRAQGLLEAFQQDLTPYLEREAGHLGEDLRVLEEWSENAEQDGIEALAGAETVTATTLKRTDYFEEQIGDADAGLAERLERLDEALRDIEDMVDDLEISAVAFVTYVNRAFAARYSNPTVEVGQILEDAGRDDVDELGLYPLDDLFGQAIPELAFPANREVDLREPHRIYWESESDGGSIA